MWMDTKCHAAVFDSPSLATVHGLTPEKGPAREEASRAQQSGHACIVGTPLRNAFGCLNRRQTSDKILPRRPCMIIEHQAAMTDVQDAQLVAEDWIVLQIHGHVRGNDGEIKDPQVGEVSSEGNKSIDGENIGHLDVQFITQAQRSDGEVDDAVKTEKKRNEVDKRDDLGSLNLAGVSETTRLRQIFQVFETGKSPQNRTIQTSASSNQVHTPQRMPVFERCLKTKQRDVLHAGDIDSWRCFGQDAKTLADCPATVHGLTPEDGSARDQSSGENSPGSWQGACIFSRNVSWERGPVLAIAVSRICPDSQVQLHGLEAGNASVNHHQDHDEESSSEDIKGFKAADLERHEDLWYRIHHQEMSFPFIVSLLRIAFKYDLADLYKDTSVRLKAYYPTTLPAWRDVCATKLTKPSADYAILVVNIARSTNTMSILPAALLHCTRVAYAKFVNGVRQPDGTLESLSAEDKDLPTFMDVTVDHWGKLSMQELEQT
ncbi:predicted protein [Postia placenta Mad-698-R]|nr:predicted protein [Postia placenta Mad-698-R]